MLFVADENIDYLVITSLRDAGFDVVSVAEEFPGVSDDHVLAFVESRSAVLLTEDKNFADILFWRHKYQNGLILLRLDGIRSEEMPGRVVHLLKVHAAEIPGAVAVISSSGVRIRKM